MFWTLRKLSPFIFTAALTACGGKSSTAPTPVTTPPPSPPPTVTAVTLTGANSINVGAGANMTASARKSDGSSENVTSTATWQSSNTAVATVSSAGRVSAVAPGSSVISAAFGGQTGQISVQVPTPDNIRRVTVQVTSIVIGGTCDTNSIFEDSADGEFSFLFELVRDGGRTTILETSKEPFKKGTNTRSHSTVFNRNVTQGEDFLLEFKGTEYDGLLGPDSRLNGAYKNQGYVYRSGQWTPNARSFSLGSGSCAATINYTIASVQL